MTDLAALPTIAEVVAETDRRRSDLTAAQARKAAPAVQAALLARLMEAVNEYRGRILAGEEHPQVTKSTNHPDGGSLDAPAGPMVSA